MDEQTIFLQALDKAPGERSAWLDEACGSGSPLRERIDALLDRHERANSFLEKPAVESESIAGRVASGGANRSVLKSLGQTLDVVPRVVLRDTSRRGGDPIVRPASKEVPVRSADSRYQLLGEIARGGMGAIIKGRDTDLGRDLAIKVLLESHKDKPEVIQRFIEEAQIGGQLQHPGIAPVYELGQFSDRRPFFSMKLVKGQTLSSLLAERGDLSEDRARFLGIFEQVCQTMAYAHSRGVIHRDLKPANIMVGAFGEVQVMDWGLAKVLAEGGVADEKKAHDTTREKSIIQTLRSQGSDTPEGFGSETQMGSVMGTPAYMAPEQALGETDRLDERTDVFGLGALLCIILTGQPPYAGEDGTQIIRQAIRGKLEDCFARLDACGADADLVDLAKHCLEVEPSDRPRNADVLAERVSHYLESVETRLHETEIDRAAQSARAEEERKRIRVTLALAASVLLLFGLGGGGWLWIGQQQAERRTAATAKVTEALSDAKLHERLADAGDLDARLQELEEAVRSAELARNLAHQDDVEDPLRRNVKKLLTGLTEREATVREQADQARADREFQTELEQIRLGQADQGERLAQSGVEIYFDIAAADDRYEKAFRVAGLDVLALEVSEAADRIRSSAIRESIIAGLDNWVRSLSDSPASSTDPHSRRAKLLAVADQADTKNWRKKLRAALKDNEIETLEQLAALEETSAQSPELIAWFGAVLRDAGDAETSVTVLKDAQQDHPGDFWLNYELAKSLRDAGKKAESVEFARAALAIRPDSFGALQSLSVALGDAGRNEDFYRIFRQVLPRTPLGHRDSGAMYKAGHRARVQGTFEGDIARVRGYTEEYPNDAKGHVLLAMMLSNYPERMDEVLALLRKAIDLKPTDAPTYSWFVHYVGGLCTDQGKLQGAIDAYRLAMRYAPNDHGAKSKLVQAYAAAEDWEGAREAARGLVEQNPRDSFAGQLFVTILVSAGERDACVEHCRRMVQTFAGTDPVGFAQMICWYKASLLLPDAVDLADLPEQPLAAALGAGTSPDWLVSWGWSARALLAYRNGDAESTLHFLQRSEDYEPNEFGNALIHAIRAMAHHELGQLKHARSDLVSASDIVDLLLADHKNKGHHDLLAAQILLREAESLINAKATSQPEEGEDTKPSYPTPN